MEEDKSNQEQLALIRMMQVNLDNLHEDIMLETEIPQWLRSHYATSINHIRVRAKELRGLLEES